MKAQSIISAPLIANYILKLKVKKIYGKMLVVLNCHLRWNFSSKWITKTPATDSSHLGQRLRWPEPQCGRHQQGWHHLARHGKSTQSAFYTTSNWVVSILPRNCETLRWKKTSKFDLEFAWILSLWTICLGPRGRAAHWEKLGMTNNEMIKPVYHVAPFSLLLEVFTE